MRRFPSHALMYLYRGRGVYVDAEYRLPLEPGSLVHVLPGRPHWYGVEGSGTWAELYLVFGGDLFDLALSSGIIASDPPIRRIVPVNHWARRIDHFRLRRPPRSPAGRDREASEVLQLLVELAGHDTERPAQRDEICRADDWFSTSELLLESRLEATIDLREIADVAGMPYETWRRSFRATAGVAPGRYRLLRRIDAARELLLNSSMSTRDIAATLGFSDERHLIRHFKATMGTTPRGYRDAQS